MKPMQLEVIDLFWEEPFKVICDKDKYKLPENNEVLEESGIYQIYGTHPVYGRDVLLYIGETKKGDRGARCFKDRLREHLNCHFLYKTNLSICLARLAENVPTEKIPLVESVLISTHAPAFNQQNLHKASAKAENILVRNWGFLGSLQHACTGYWKNYSGIAD